MRNFSIYMIAGSLTLFLLAPLWGFACRDIQTYYGIKYVYGLYLTMVPWLIYFSIAGVWLLKLMPKEG